MREWANRSRLAAGLLMMISLYSLILATREEMWSLWQLFRVGAVLLFGHAAHVVWHRAELHKPSVYDDRSSTGPL